MSLEQALADNTAALKALTAALEKGGVTTAGGPAADKSTKSTKNTKEQPAAYTPQHTKDEMLAALTEMKEAIGLPETKKLIKEVGKKDKMGEIEDPETIDKVYDAAKKAVEDAANKAGENDGL